MRKFLEELEKSKRKQDTPQVSEVWTRYMTLKAEYKTLRGKRAIYTSGLTQSGQESRLVRVEEAYDTFILLSYPYYSLDYQGRGTVCCSYSSLLCGEDRLVME